MWSFLISGCVSVKAETACRFLLYCTLVLQRTHTCPYWFWQFNNYIYIKKGHPDKTVQRYRQWGHISVFLFTRCARCYSYISVRTVVFWETQLCPVLPVRRSQHRTQQASAVMILLLTALKEVELGCKVACRYATTPGRLKLLKKPNLCEVHAGGDQLIWAGSGISWSAGTAWSSTSWPVWTEALPDLYNVQTHRPWGHSMYSFKTFKILTQEIREHKHMRRVFGGNQRQRD